MKYTITNGKLTVTADTLGAELVSVKQGEREWLWQNSTGDWAGHSPLLFPVCGHTRLTHEGVEYPIKAHGFAKRCEFTLAEKGEDFLKFTLVANEETKKVYPFDFVFHMIYRIKDNTLTVEHVVENPMENPIFFACGGHESFEFAAGKNIGDYELVFEKTEKFLHRVHNDEGYLTDEIIDFGESDRLPLPVDFLQKGRTLILKDIKSRKLRLCEKGGKCVAEISFAEEFPNLLLWRANNAPYICIEPWSNLPDPDPEKAPVDIEFSTKNGVMKVEAGGVKTLVRSIEYK